MIFPFRKKISHEFPEDYPKHLPRLFGVPRSGGTFIYNVIDYLFDGQVEPQRHGYFSVPDGGKAVAIYRDFRDSAVSEWRVYEGKFANTAEKRPCSFRELKKYLKKRQQNVEVLNRFKQDFSRPRGDVPSRPVPVLHNRGRPAIPLPTHDPRCGLFQAHGERYGGCFPDVRSPGIRPGCA